MPTQLTEKDRDVLDGWYEEAREVTSMEKFQALYDRMLGPDSPRHDYGTICHAVAALAIAAAWLANASPQGGITGFQAGAVMWEFIQSWNHTRGEPQRLVQYSNMLYPQYEGHFEKTISADTWKWLQENAAKKLTEAGGTPWVREHWQRIADGVVPFGYLVREED